MEVIFTETIGKRLEYLREQRGWTKTYVAEKLNLKAIATYANWEYDLRQPNPIMLVKLADFFGVTTDYLLGRKTSEQDYKVSKNERCPHCSTTLYKGECISCLKEKQEIVTEFFDMVDNESIPLSEERKLLVLHILNNELAELKGKVDKIIELR